jgi:hypothetical protein
VDDVDGKASDAGVVAELVRTPAENESASSMILGGVARWSGAEMMRMMKMMIMRMEKIGEHVGCGTLPIIYA